MNILNHLKKTYTLKKRDLAYINKYQREYKKILKEAKKRDNDRFVMESKDRTKAMWQLINSATGKPQTENINLELRIGDQITSNPTDITEGLNIHFISTVEKLVKHNIHSKSYKNLEINHCSNTVFIDPVSEDEVVNLSKNLEGKATAGYDDIPENLVKYCIHLIKKTTGTYL